MEHNTDLYSSLIITSRSARIMTEFNKWHMQQTEGVKHHCTALAELTKHNSTSEQRACFFSFAASAPHIRQLYWPVTFRSSQNSPKPDIPPFPKINSDRRCLHAPRRRERILMPAKVHAGECFKIQPATMGNILAIKKKRTFVKCNCLVLWGCRTHW